MIDTLQVDCLRMIHHHLEMKDVVSLYVAVRYGSTLSVKPTTQRFKYFLNGDERIVGKVARFKH